MDQRSRRRTHRAAALLIAWACAGACSVEDGDPDAGARADAGCGREARLGCPCAPIGTVMCRAPGPDLLCAAGTWVASFDGPCPGLDAGGHTLDAAIGLDAGAGPDAAAERDADAAIESDAAAGATDAAPSADATVATDAPPPVDAGPPAMATYCVDIDVSNECVMTVTPTEITIPPGQTAYFCWRNRSSDYSVDVWLSYGGGYTDLAPGATWNEPVGHCIGPTARTEHADISTACSEHRFLIRCL